ncbi:MAG: hypothetical protein KUA35_01130 [Pseudodesulfovibrio sp.]|nr:MULTISPECIES: hypothetical protein [Pseudodesulfovibrio]MBU4244027.1 hypothetical protein [Pseudomonadota bacterium]MBU4516949.1 hypothetical protein [Pseudomonadota bacterium]MBV1766389.1 hypothetical protein [Pseudodesulfovibrio sp.]MBV1771015.1 hypothetical protein [Pseudodesulfovibrio sp.]
MQTVATFSLLILIAALLRRSLLTPPDATPGIRDGDDETDDGFKTLVPVVVRASSPHSTRRPKSGAKRF